MLMTGMALKKETKGFIYHCIKALSGKTGHTHIEVMGLTGDNATSIKCILDTLEGHCKPRSKEIVAATAYKQQVQGNLVCWSTQKMQRSHSGVQLGYSL